MTPESIPVRDITSLECRTCGAGAPVDEHFCPNCSRLLALGRHGDYFSFLGLPRALTIDAADLDRRFRELSRKFHPDFYYNAAPVERLASLERSSYLNDAVRVLRNPVSRIEHLLAIEGLPPAKTEEGTAKVPPGLLEEVFALNEELDEIRDLLRRGVPENARPFGGLVYRQALEHLHGLRDETATRALIAQENRRYARRQLIWFRKEPNLHWFDGPGETPATIAAVERLLDSQ
jgi:molecular chaperone HscB